MNGARFFAITFTGVLRFLRRCFLGLLRHLVVSQVMLQVI
jgi:hypothetical protein